MKRLTDPSRLSLAAALAGIGSLLVADLLSGESFSLGLRYLKRAVLDEGLGGTVYANGESGGPVALLLFAIAIGAALIAYLRSLYEIAAGTRLAASIVRMPGTPGTSLRDRLARAASILTERRRPAADRASSAVDALLAPIAGEGVTVTRPEPVRPVATPPWRMREGQRTGSTGNTDRWAMPDREDEA